MTRRDFLFVLMPNPKLQFTWDALQSPDPFPDTVAEPVIEELLAWQASRSPQQACALNRSTGIALQPVSLQFLCTGDAREGECYHPAGARGEGHVVVR